MPTYHANWSLPLTAIQHKRLLPIPGEVLVQVGDLVEPDEIVARCQLPGKIWAADVSRSLGVNREEANQYMRHAAGDSVRAGDVLAERDRGLSLLGRRCKAALDGEIIALQQGVVFVQPGAIMFELRAQIPGRIVDVIPGRGVSISAIGALVRGLWASGGEASGSLRVVVDAPDEPLTTGALETEDPVHSASDDQAPCSQCVVVGGSVRTKATLERAAAAQVAGLVVGSIDANLYQWLEALPYPVLATEGFGELAMDPATFALLEANKGRTGTIITDPRPGWEREYPELFIPLDADQNVASQRQILAPLELGVRVRGLRAPFHGASGKIVDLPVLPQVVGDSRIRSLVAQVEWDDGELATIPLANLQVAQ